MKKPSTAASILPVLSELHASFAQFIERQAASKWYILKLVAAIVVLTFVFQPTRFGTLLKYANTSTHGNGNIEMLKFQINHPFTNSVYPPASHQAKMTFRLVPPLLARAVHMGVVGAWLVQVLFGCVMFAIMYLLLRREFDDPVAATIFTTGTALTYFGYAYLFDINIFFDAISYSFLVAMLYFDNKIGLILLTIGAGFNDERALLGSLLPMFWHATAVYRRQPLPDAPIALRFNQQVLAIILGWIGYFALRYAVASYFHLITHTTAVGTSVLAYNMKNSIVQTAFVSTLESYWIFVFLFVVLGVYQKQYFIVIIFLGCLAPLVLGAYFVYDVTRSMAYVFPASIIGAVIVRRQFSRISFQQLVLVVWVMAALISSVMVMNGYPNTSGSFLEMAAYKFGLETREPLL